MKEKVYYIPSEKYIDDNALCSKLKDLIKSENLLDFIKPHDMIPIKTHFGEKKDLGVARPVYFTMLGDIIRSKKAYPFLTETSTLYKGDRSNAIDHIRLAQRHGYGCDKTGLPVIMADGLLGDEEIEVAIPGKIYSKVKIAALLAKVQGLVVVSHFTGHLAAGFGAALKNIGMGLSSRRGKMIQHSTAKPRIKPKACTKCGVCITWCPSTAITMQDTSAHIDSDMCIGCGQCLAMCRFDAVIYNWLATYEDLQKKVVEHAMGVVSILKENIFYINVLTRISKDCDCMHSFEKIAPDIGLLVSRDPVALDSASFDLVEKIQVKS